jgi:hypothetical protein
VRRPAVLAVAAALVLLLAIPALASASPEARIRRRLGNAIHKTAAAKSLAARAVLELGEPGGPHVPIYRLEERIEDSGTRKTRDRRFPPGRWTSDPTNEVITVGHRAWYRAKSDPYREATLGPKIVTGFEPELANLERAVAVGKNLRALGGDRYEVTAPSKAINGPEGGSEPIRLIISLSAVGYLRKAERIEDGAAIFIAETFTDFGKSFGIAQPPAEEIADAPTKKVTSQDEFSALLGAAPLGD